MTDDWNPNDEDATRVHYDLARWTFDRQAELAADLADGEVPHAWDGSELIVPDDQEAAVDAIIASVEERLGIADDVDIDDGASAPEPIELGDDVMTTEYDLGEWSDAERSTVGSALTNQHLPFGWTDDVLLVATDHEDAVEAILDLVERGEWPAAPTVMLPDGEDVEGLAADGADAPDGRLPFETLTTFFLAGERLKKHPLDAGGLAELLEALEVADPATPPYGVEQPLWLRTCELADELADALAGEDEPDEEEATEIATELHDLLRPYV